MSQLLRARFQPASLPPWLLVAVTVFFAALTGLRGVDWFSADPSTLSVVLTSGWVPLRATGLGLLVGAVFLIGAIAARRHFFVWLAHIHLAFIYTGIALAGLPVAVALGSGYSALAAPVGGALWHVVLFRITGPRPRTSNATHQGGARRAGTD